MKYQKWMSAKSSLKVTGAGRVQVAGLKQAVKAAKKVGALQGADGSSGSGTAAKDLGKRLLAAGEYVAEIARANASWSEQIPPAIKVGGGQSGVTIRCRVGPAYPNEVAGVRHPTFGHNPWVTNQHRPFLAPAGDAGAQGAAEIVAQVIDDWAAEYGFK